MDCSISGHEISSGRPVTIHLLAGGYSLENLALFQKITELPQEYRVCFLDSGEYRGIPYVVTDVLTGKTPLREWMGVIERKRAERTNPEDLTRVRVWKIPTWVQGGEGHAPEAPAEPPPATVPPAPAPAAEIEDEFSLMLGEHTAPAAEPAAPMVPPPPPPASGPGEFTRLMQAQSQPSAPTPPPPASEPGEFTRLMQAQQ
ncbi:MAG: hypothetical protein JST11_17790, partial [Acidobacteria bacterium]|nr:hypothetical protein [Acidobacteriota bacterium]